MEVLVCSFFKDLMSLHWFSLKPLISAMIVPVFEFSQFPYDYERWLQGSTHQKYHLWIHKRPVKWFHANEDQIRRLMYGVCVCDFCFPSKALGVLRERIQNEKVLYSHFFDLLWPFEFVHVMFLNLKAETTRQPPQKWVLTETFFLCFDSLFC